MADDKKLKKTGYYHSVRLAEDRCIGCTHCVRECPTEAIRVRGGKAVINPVRCIDCGACIRVCPTDAKYAQTDPLEAIEKYQYKIALPSSAFSGQFKTSIPPDNVLSALLSLGFDEVYEAALGGEIVTLATRRFLENDARVKPVISSLCPAVVRLVQVRFPSLTPHVMRLEAPMDAAARVLKMSRSRHLGIPENEIGIFFITPCSAKATAIKQPEATRASNVAGAIAISDVYNRVMGKLETVKVVPGIARASGLALGWGAAGGENTLIGKGRRLAVDGVANVVKVLELIEGDEYHHGYDYLELRACTGGCVGGPLTVEDPFVAENRIEHLRSARSAKFGIEEGKPPDLTYEEITGLIDKGEFDLKRPLEPRPTLQLGTDIKETISLMKKLEGVFGSLPGIDCGSCGAPTCRAFAEDVVMDKAHLTDCTFKLREELQNLAKEMSILSGRLPPTLKNREGAGDYETTKGNR